MSRAAKDRGVRKKKGEAFVDGSLLRARSFFV